MRRAEIGSGGLNKSSKIDRMYACFACSLFLKMTKSNSSDRQPPESKPEPKPELSLTPPKVQRPKPPEIVQRPRRPQTTPSAKPEATPEVKPEAKPERASKVPKPRKVQDAPRLPKMEQPEPVPEYGGRKAGDRIVLPYSGKSVEISHFYETAGHWYAAFEVGCVRADLLEKSS